MLIKFLATIQRGQIYKLEKTLIGSRESEMIIKVKGKVTWTEREIMETLDAI